MRLTSAAFQDGGMIPRDFTCDGADRSPPLSWTNAPVETKSFVFIVDDIDAPRGVFRHWACFDVPPEQTSLAEDDGRVGKAKLLRHAVNDFGESGYNGPCPPHGHGMHRYRFRLFALSCPRLPTGASPSCEAVEAEAQKHLLSEARIVGRYGR
jgi:Raf kinase inhibitor-like YbhB/YbcL family protein